MTNAWTPSPGGEGEGRVRADLRLAMRAIREKCDIPPVIMQAIVAKATRVLQAPDAGDRAVARASATILAVQRQQYDAALAEDRIQRLDAGEVTDRGELAISLTDDQLAAVAASILPASAPPCPPAPEQPKAKPRRPKRKPRG